MIDLRGPTTKPPAGTPLNIGHPLAAGLVGSWLFNENAGSVAVDSAGSNLRASLPASTLITWAPRGPQYVSGNSWITLPPVAFAGGRQPFCFSWGCAVDNLTADTYLLAQNMDYASIICGYVDNTFELYSFQRANSALTIPDTAFHNYAYVYTGSVFSRWRDGVMVGSCADTTGPAGAFATSKLMGISGVGWQGTVSHLFLYRGMVPADPGLLTYDPFAMYRAPRRWWLVAAGASDVQTYTRAVAAWGADGQTLTRAVQAWASAQATLTRVTEAMGADPATYTRAAQAWGLQVSTLTKAVELYGAEVATLTRVLAAYGDDPQTLTRIAASWGADALQELRTLAAWGTELVALTRAAELWAKDPQVATRAVEAWGAGGADALTRLFAAYGISTSTGTWAGQAWAADPQLLTRGVALWATSGASTVLYALQSWAADAGLLTRGAETWGKEVTAVTAGVRLWGAGGATGWLAAVLESGTYY